MRVGKNLPAYLLGAKFRLIWQKSVDISKIIELHKFISLSINLFTTNFAQDSFIKRGTALLSLSAAYHATDTY